MQRAQHLVQKAYGRVVDFLPCQGPYHTGNHDREHEQEPVHVFPLVSADGMHQPGNRQRHRYGLKYPCHQQQTQVLHTDKEISLLQHLAEVIQPDEVHLRQRVVRPGPVGKRPVKGNKNSPVIKQKD